MEKGYGLDPDLNARILWDEEGRRNGGFRGSWIDFWEYLGKCYSYMKEVKKEKVKDPSIGIIQLIRQSDVKFLYVLHLIFIQFRRKNQKNVDIF